MYHGKRMCILMLFRHCKDLLTNQDIIIELCETWRKRNVPDGWLTDFYDGKLWKQWMSVDSVPLLQTPGNLALMLNLDWFQPFNHTQYSVGVVYLFVQNLPRIERLKLKTL